MKVNHNSYHKLTTKKNIFRGFKAFLKGKKHKQDVINFSQNKEVNLEKLHAELVSKTYLPGKYSQFIVRDPKTRIIHKACVVDRIVHHIVSDVLEDNYDSTFIYHSYACRKDKGTHKGIRESKNNRRTCWILKCDISKFFASVNHEKLTEILSRRVKDQEFLDLLEKIVNSFYSDKTTDLSNKKGIPIGNLTSQLFSNIYLNELDQFVKHTLKVKFYLRYADDFAFISYDREYLLGLIDPLQKFLKGSLDLDLHPKKIILRKFSSGVDFLGYIIFPKYILPRTKTKRRLVRKIHEKVKQFKAGEISEESLNQTIQSYYGFLIHANTYEFKQKLQNLIMFWLTE
jgi:retron-type reverse transcriptase